MSHVCKSLFGALNGDGMSFIKWPCAVERGEMKGLIFGFEQCIGFVDGTKQYFSDQPRWSFEKNGTAGTTKIFHFVLLWTDVYGMEIRLDLKLEGAENDQSTYNETGSFR